MRNLIFLFLLLSSTLTLWAADPQSATSPQIAARVQDAVPLTVGSKAPDALVTATDGAVVHLATLCAGRPTVLIFFRGAWCPYCNAHLAKVQTIQDQLIKLGWQTVAIGTDTPETTQKSAEDKGLAYRLFSDRELNAASAFGVAYRLDADTVAKYAKYKVPMVSPNNAGPALPIPSVFLINDAGVIAFVHANADITKRIDPADLLAAAIASRKP